MADGVSADQAGEGATEPKGTAVTVREFYSVALTAVRYCSECGKPTSTAAMPVGCEVPEAMPLVCLDCAGEFCRPVARDGG